MSDFNTIRDYHNECKRAEKEWSTIATGAPAPPQQGDKVYYKWQSSDRYFSDERETYICPIVKTGQHLILIGDEDNYREVDEVAKTRPVQYKIKLIDEHYLVTPEAYEKIKAICKEDA